MDQITTRIIYIYSIRRDQKEKVLEKYHISPFEYLILSELSYHEEIDIDKIYDQVEYRKIINDIVKSLVKKEYVNDDHGKLTLTKKYKKIEKKIENSVKDVDKKFEKKMSIKKLNKYIDMLDELIDYMED